jgi:hypothetical protein
VPNLRDLDADLRAARDRRMPAQTRARISVPILGRPGAAEKNIENSNYVTSPRQKLPEISPILKADTVRLHVSREKDGKWRLDAGWDDTKVV